ncbi:MAG: cytidine deaminase [Candidatus Cloacimonetes bacterium]|nr:cytidine deaminase [Candidatus Cloacimonadota bacterium]
MKNDDLKLIDAARKAADRAYAPYSGYKVGAAIRSKKGNIYTGCNIENASYSLTVCAERNALAQAVINGEKEFSVIAIYVDSDMLFPPCGACRQVLSEFSLDLRVIYANKNEIHTALIKELLPESFQLRKV